MSWLPSRSFEPPASWAAVHGRHSAAARRGAPDPLGIEPRGSVRRFYPQDAARSGGRFCRTCPVRGLGGSSGCGGSLRPRASCPAQALAGFGARTTARKRRGPTPRSSAFSPRARRSRSTDRPRTPARGGAPRTCGWRYRDPLAGGAPGCGAGSGFPSPRGRIPPRRRARSRDRQAACFHCGAAIRAAAARSTAPVGPRQM